MEAHPESTNTSRASPSTWFGEWKITFVILWWGGRGGLWHRPLLNYLIFIFPFTLLKELQFYLKQLSVKLKNDVSAAPLLIRIDDMKQIW